MTKAPHIPALGTVIFDMDGVVLDSQAAANRALVDAAFAELEALWKARGL